MGKIKAQIIRREGNQVLLPEITDVCNVSEKIKYDVMVKSLKLDYNFIVESLVPKEINGFRAFELTNTIIDSIDLNKYIDRENLEINAKVLSSILYGELYRIALEYTRMTGLNVDDFLSKAKLQLDGICIKTLRIIYK